MSHLNHTSSPMEEKRNELLTDISERVAAFLAQYNIQPDVAEHCGIDLANYLAEDWGGQGFTIPKDYYYKLASRNEEIYAKFNGHNYEQLAKEFDLTENAIYRIVGKMRTLMRARQQPDFFTQERPDDGQQKDSRP